MVWTPESLAAEGAVASLRGMLADRYVMLTQGSSADVLAHVLGEVVPICKVVDLRRGVAKDTASTEDRFVAELARRRAAKRQTVVEPTWPQLLSAEDRASAQQRVEAPEPGRSALTLANDVARTWSTWLSLETLRSTRTYLVREPANGPSLPEAFTDGAKLMTLHASKP